MRLRRRGARAGSGRGPDRHAAQRRHRTGAELRSSAILRGMPILFDQVAHTISPEAFDEAAALIAGRDRVGNRVEDDGHAAQYRGRPTGAPGLARCGTRAPGLPKRAPRDHSDRRGRAARLPRAPGDRNDPSAVGRCIRRHNAASCHVLGGRSGPLVYTRVGARPGGSVAGGAPPDPGDTLNRHIRPSCSRLSPSPAQPHRQHLRSCASDEILCPWSPNST